MRFCSNKWRNSAAKGRSPKLTRKEGDNTAEVSWVYGVPLNESNQDVRVDFLEYNEFDADGKRVKHFTWITDLHITLRNAWLFARGGRARWRIENETFNTLKNQGYHYEHNFGHGQRNLSVVFAMLMMLAFLVDQVQQLCCPLFRAVWEKLGASARCGTTCVLCFAIFASTRCGNSTKPCCTILPRKCRSRGGTPPDTPLAVAAARALRA